MTNESIPLRGRLIANAVKRPPEPALLRYPRFRRRDRASENYRKYRSIRIDNVTKQIVAIRLTLSAKPLKNNAVLSARQVSRFFGNGAATGRRSPGGQGGGVLEWAVAQGLCGLFRVGA